jgi:hypothetical protein
MAFGAMGLAALIVIPTSTIFGAGHRLKVCGKDARSVAAEVIEFEPLGDRPNIMLVERPVRISRLTRDLDLAITSGA